MQDYFDNWKEKPFTCPECHWTGKGADLADGEVFSYLQELDCPKCHGRITSLVFPTLDELQARRNKLSEADRVALEKREKWLAEFEGGCLKEVAQLPAIADASFVLAWDFREDGALWETVIRHGERVIFAELAVYEGRTRFHKVAEILRARYGPALRDLIPTPEAGFFLHGDDICSPAAVAELRRRIFAAEGLPAPTPSFSSHPLP